MSCVRGGPSSADGSNRALHPWVETAGHGSTLAAMTRTAAGPTVPGMKLPFTREPHEPLGLFGTLAMTAIFIVSLATEPRPGLHGDGPWVALALAGFAVGVLVSAPHRKVPDLPRVAGLVALGAATCALIALQPNTVVYGAAYYVVIAAALRLDLVPALIIAGLMLAGASVAIGFTVDDPYTTIASIYVSVVPWFLVMRLIGGLHEGRAKAEDLVEELRESRAAHAESAALAERGRVARDMHDVLAHSLSALALQLEGARLLAQDRDSDPEVVAAVERAHHLAAEGLSEARDAIGALRGDELPGPERLQQLAEGYAGDCRVTVSGTPRELGSEARLAVYRTAQEALTNVLRHSAADRVEIALTYEDGGTRLVVQDHGPGAPVAVGPGTPGGGYGLTGMGERAELLGGRLSAEPTADGFRVELWLPA
jgi:signal transduction histidine kinase